MGKSFYEYWYPNPVTLSLKTAIFFTILWLMTLHFHTRFGTHTHTHTHAHTAFVCLHSNKSAADKIILYSYRQNHDTQIQNQLMPIPPLTVDLQNLKTTSIL